MKYATFRKLSMMDMLMTSLMIKGPGVCFRLYTESDFDRLQDASVPEIMRCSLTASMLQLKCLGLDLETLDFMDKPDTDASKITLLIHLERRY